MDPVYLALGSNLGDREAYLRSAIQGLIERQINVVRCASVYSTEPLEVLSQPWFLNTVIEVDTPLAPQELLSVCLQIEKENDRKRESVKGPRTIDIDIIFYGQEVIRKPGLTIPHPSFSNRRFVLVPLAEIAPDFTDPRSGKSVLQLLEACSGSSIVTPVCAAPIISHPFRIQPL